MDERLGFFKHKILDRGQMKYEKNFNNCDRNNCGIPSTGLALPCETARR